MLTRLHWIIIGFLVGSPIGVFGLLYVLSPGYLVQFFLPNDYFDGIIVLIFLTVTNFLILYFGLRSSPKGKEKRKSDEVGKFSCRESGLIILCTVLFTLPSLYIVIMYPAAIRLLQEYR